MDESAGDRVLADGEDPVPRKRGARSARRRDPGSRLEQAARVLLSAAHARYIGRRTVLRHSGTAPNLLNGDAAYHPWVYRAVVLDRSFPQESDCVSVSRVQHPRVERAIVGGYGMRLFVFVDPRYFVPGGNGRIGPEPPKGPRPGRIATSV